ncbi:hypothetical protein [Longispora albida]|uniref:hypothetical protein n=1 Tax=Longispora albida TaxID=203523 RepID=UPI00037CEE6C|nr:hypothetical protein [Longispora albida]
MTTLPDPVQLAEAASQAKVDLVRVAAERQNTIRDLAARLAEARSGYAPEYKAVLAAWGETETSRFGLLDPDKVAEVATPKRARPSGTRTVKKPAATPAAEQ